ncbi:NAD(P)/FAD-dependent oxidoreductase [Lentilactobacillus sp. Marseille-Q4993]|uniref:NAD(P)/FAD-dependent oxidoreductase n=1 Tax=Lentilactobacillus sp. Marseille-Q4993 TaxID=3039492 RepID=UPI0024BC3698|nr:NAD(P)/FAD-dependent oxidoreductase [Lentilactobacillus sp. Marseille-Q4993]
MNDSYSIVIIGAGPAGVGLGVTLQNYGISNFVILDKDKVGSTFDNWNHETHFISPSFTTNGFGYPDLNAVTPNSSPAFSLQSEHPSGQEYATYLRTVSLRNQLPVIGNTEVTRIIHNHNSYQLQLSSHQVIEARYVFVGIGDFSYPYSPEIPGKNFGIHYSSISDYDDFEPTEQTIIGGNEAGFDAAINLAKRGIRSTIFTDTTAIDSQSPDPSKRLSTFTLNRFLNYMNMIRIVPGKELISIRKGEPERYYLTFSDTTTAVSQTRPIFATGFAACQSPLIKETFEVKNNRPVLNHYDESTLYPNIFLIGPQVTHDDVVLCYVYKYRQRFAPLTEEILARNGLIVNPMITQAYKDANMYLDNFDECDVDCEC